MTIWTSYFGNVRKLHEKFPNMIFVSIAGRTPESKTVNIRKFPEVAPKYSWWKDWHDRFSGNLDSEESKTWYFEKYADSLFSKHDIKWICGKLEKTGGGNDVCLLCYETPEKFCHRHLLANWLSEYLQYEVKEITCD